MVQRHLPLPLPLPPATPSSPAVPASALAGTEASCIRVKPPCMRVQQSARTSAEPMTCEDTSAVEGPEGRSGRKWAVATAVITGTVLAMPLPPLPLPSPLLTLLVLNLELKLDLALASGRLLLLLAGCCAPLMPSRSQRTRSKLTALAALAAAAPGRDGMVMSCRAGQGRTRKGPSK